MKTTSTSVQRLTKLALLLAIELAMRAIGLGAVPVGPLNMSFLTLPIAIAAMLCGPVEGMVLGAVFGILSLTDAISGRSFMTGTFFNISPVHTVILCVGMRMLMGFCCGYVYKLCRRADAKGTWSYFVGAVSAPLLNTLFFMGYIVLVFYRCDYVQGLVSKLGATNPLMFVVLLVGIQGLVNRNLRRGRKTSAEIFWLRGYALSAVSSKYRLRYCHAEFSQETFLPMSRWTISSQQ